MSSISSLARPAAAGHYYLGHHAGATQCLFVGPSGATRTLDYASFSAQHGHNVEWAGHPGSGWQAGHELVVKSDRQGHLTIRPASATSTRISGTSTVVFQYHRPGHSTVTSPKLHQVGWMTYAKAGCPTE